MERLSILTFAKRRVYPIHRMNVAVTDDAKAHGSRINCVQMVGANDTYLHWTPIKHTYTRYHKLQLNRIPPVCALIYNWRNDLAVGG